MCVYGRSWKKQKPLLPWNQDSSIDFQLLKLMSKEAYIHLFQNAVQLNTVYAAKFKQANFLFTCERSVPLIAF